MAFHIAKIVSCFGKDTQKNRKLYLLLLGDFTNCLSSMIALYLTLYMRKSGYDTLSIGLAHGCVALGGLIGAYVGGIAADRVDIKKNIIASQTSSVILCFVIYNSTNYFIFIILLFLLSITQNIYRPSFTLSLLKNCSKRMKPIILSIKNASMNVSMGCSAYLGIKFLHIGQSIFFFDAVMIMLSLTIFLYSMRYCNVKSDENLSLYNKKFKPTRIPLKTILLLMVIFSNFLIISQLKTTFPLVLDTKGFDHDLISYIYVINTLIVIMLEVPLVGFVQRYNRTYVLIIGSAFLSTGMFLTGSLSDFIPAVFMISIFTLGEILFFPSSMLAILDNSDAKGSKIGLYQLSANFAQFVGPVLGFYLLSQDRSMILWFGCLLLGFLCCIVLFFTNR